MSHPRHLGCYATRKEAMILIQRQPASHWYLRDGTAFHEIAKKDGSGNRPVTLADARKVLALPSVTNVLGVLSKPTLEAWKIEQGILSALTLPRRPRSEERRVGKEC